MPQCARFHLRNTYSRALHLDLEKCHPGGSVLAAVPAHIAQEPWQTSGAHERMLRFEHVKQSQILDSRLKFKHVKQSLGPIFSDLTGLDAEANKTSKSNFLNLFFFHA